GVEMPAIELVPGSSDMTLERLIAVAGRMGKDGDFRMSVEEVFASLVMIETGHEKDHAVGQIEIVRPDHGVKKLDHGQVHRLRRAVGQSARADLNGAAPGFFGQNVESSHVVSSRA